MGTAAVPGSARPSPLSLNRGLGPARPPPGAASVPSPSPSQGQCLAQGQHLALVLSMPGCAPLPSLGSGRCILQNPKMAAEGVPAAARRVERQAEGSGPPKEEAWGLARPGLGLMAWTKLLPSPSPEKGSQCHALSFCSDLEGAALAWLLEWTGRRGKVWAGGGGEGHCLRKVGLDH